MAESATQIRKLKSKHLEPGVYAKPDLPQNPKEWKLYNAQRRAKKRQWKEDELLRQHEKEKKRKVAEEVAQEEKEQSEVKSGLFTLSIALPGSILDNAQSPELRTYLAGQIARAAVIFNVNEIIIFDEGGESSKTTDGEFKGVGKKGNANVQLARILQYLECPQYLRKAFFPQHSDLLYAGLLNPLDCPHHMRSDDTCVYREGVVLDKPTKPGKGSFVNVGLRKHAQIDRSLQAGVRVTVKMDLSRTAKKKIYGRVVSPRIPQTEGGLYWGYSVRVATSLSTVFTESPYKGGYDVMIGTSERGDSIDDVKLPKFNHGLIVFGGVQGLEASLEADDALDIEDPSLLFPVYVNVCPHQGSRTIRTEEAILVTLSALRPQLQTISSDI